MKYSLHVGINDYPGYNNDLRGCVNDMNGWLNLAKDTYGFETISLQDKEATKMAIVNKLNSLIKKAKSGDDILFTFSGHGTSVPDKNGDEIDGKDEAFCAWDTILLDDEMHLIMETVPEDVYFTIIADCCHSGTITRSFLRTIENNTNDIKVRYKPHDIDDLEIDFSKLPIKSHVYETRNGLKKREILFTGCMDHEFSYDAYFKNSFYGAMSYNSFNILKRKPLTSNYDFYLNLKEKLPSTQYPQTPLIHFGEEMQNRLFLGGPSL
jgi:hypothetical protein